MRLYLRRPGVPSPRVPVEQGVGEEARDVRRWGRRAAGLPLKRRDMETRARISSTKQLVISRVAAERSPDASPPPRREGERIAILSYICFLGR